MTKEKKGPGAPTKMEKDKNRRRNVMLPPEVDDWINTLPDGKRSKVVTNSLRIYKALLEGKVSFDETKTDPDFDLATILH